MAICDTNIYTYYIYYTDGSTGAIAVPIDKSALDSSTLDITLVGKSRLEYGEVFNENILHLLENFSSPSSTELTPDQANTYLDLLENPIIGQLWYNSEFKQLNVCTSITPITWINLKKFNNMAGNNGFLFNGETIPLPVTVDGYVIPETNCVWHVSPAFMMSRENQNIVSFNLTSINRNINFEYVTSESNHIPGVIHYIILGIRDENSPTPIE